MASSTLMPPNAMHRGSPLSSEPRTQEYRSTSCPLPVYRAQAEGAFQAFRSRWCRTYPTMVRRLQQDLRELLSFFAFPRHLLRKLRTTNVIERCFIEVRRRTRPMVCFVNVESVQCIIYSIFQRFNLEWKTRTLNLFTQAA